MTRQKRDVDLITTVLPSVCCLCKENVKIQFKRSGKHFVAEIEEGKTVSILKFQETATLEM